MSRQDLLTVFFGERDRTATGWLSDEIGRLAAEHDLRASVLLRGSAGYGPHHVEQSDVLLSFSDDLPLVMLCFDEPDRLAPFSEALERLGSPAHLSCTTGSTVREHTLTAQHARLIAVVDRHDRRSRQPAHRAIIDLLHEHGAAGASALLGVDGTRDGRRTRSRFLSRNAGTPTVVISVGERPVIERAAAEIADRFPGAAVLLQDATVLKRDGRPIAPAEAASDATVEITVYASTASRASGGPLEAALLRALRRAGAPGATALRGIWGYHGDHEPHGDRFWALRRTVPLLTLTATDAEHLEAVWGAVDQATDLTGLVVMRSDGLADVHSGQ